MNDIYSAVEVQCAQRGWDSVDLVVIGGDFQAVRNSADLTCMAVPVKYRAMGDFHEYYSGQRRAPYLTIYAGGNHEASNYHWELPYGGWVAPNIYYLGHANVVQVAGVRIGALSGIWKPYNYRKKRFERPPYTNGEERSTYSQRETDVRKLLQLREQIDVMLSHDWPRGVEWNGNWEQLFRCKRHFEKESRDGLLGSVAGKILLDRLRPKKWFSAHMHVKFEAHVKHPPNPSIGEKAIEGAALDAPLPVAEKTNEAEIEIELDDDNGVVPAPPTQDQSDPAPSTNPDEIDLDMDEPEQAPVSNSGQQGAAPEVAEPQAQTTSSVPDDVRAQLPASFLRPSTDSQNQGSPAVASQHGHQSSHDPLPPGITNRLTYFLALDKYIPGRRFLSLLTARAPQPIGPEGAKLSYDPEWLAIIRALAPELDQCPPTTGPADVANVPDKGISGYEPLVSESRKWVTENIVSQADDKAALLIPENFCVTAPTYADEKAMLEAVDTTPATEGEEGEGRQPGRTRLEVKEYQNPQTKQFCDLVGIPNPCEAPAPVRSARRDREGDEDAEDDGDGCRHDHGHGQRNNSGWRGGGHGGGHRGGRGGWGDHHRRGRGGHGHGRGGRGRGGRGRGGGHRDGFGAGQ